MRKLKCRCGKDFSTPYSQKIYCSSECQEVFSKRNAWESVKQDYKFRCRKLKDMAKGRAKRSNLAFDLTQEYLENIWNSQNGCCAISGREFLLRRPENCTVEARAPSLDRITPKLGYVQGNVRFVCYQVNTALNEYGKEALLDLCKDILNYNKEVLRDA